MDIEKFSYLWNEEKEDWVLVNTGYAIVNKRDQRMLLISDDEKKQQVINKMLLSGTKVYNSLNQAYGDC